MYKYTIIQEDVSNKSKLSYEFSAHDEDDFVENITSFMHSTGWIIDGSLEINYEDFDDIDSEYNDYRNPDVEGFKNFEFPPAVSVGSGQTHYSFDTSDMDNIYESSQQTFDFPMDRPSEQTYRIDSLYEVSNTANASLYYGA